LNLFSYYFCGSSYFLFNESFKVFSVPGVFDPELTRVLRQVILRQAQYQSEIKPVNLIRVMPAQGRMAVILPFLLQHFPLIFNRLNLKK
jgi:hypothetical protein